MQMDDTEIPQDLYQRTRDDLLKRQLSNSENFDRAILTLSSAALGLSLTFVKNVVQVDDARCLWLLVFSWVLFVASIIVTLVSFHVSQVGIKTQLRHAKKYYLERNDEFLGKRNVAAELTEWFGYASALVFVVAIVCLVTFISLNIRREDGPMSEDKLPKASTNRRVNVEKEVDTLRAALISEIQAVPGQDANAGAVIPEMQGIPESPQNSGADGESDGAPSGNSGSDD